MANSSGSNIILDIRDLDVSFFTTQGEVRAVNGVTYALRDGEVLGIVGESGSGKSVSAYAMMGLIPEPGRVKNGTIEFDGKAIHTMSERELQKIRGNEISIIFQDPMTSLNPVFTIGSQIMEVLMLHTDMNKQQARRRAIELLELVGVNEPARRIRQYPHEFSGGMRQRVMIAMALACEPKLLIADEPTTALDVTIQAQILELMNDLKDKLGMSIILITHDLGVVAQMCEKIIVMYAGMVLERGTSEDLFYRPNHPYTVGLLQSIPNPVVDEHIQLIPIEGSPVDSLNLPAGCPFAPRCRHCMRICLTQMPPDTALSDTHTSACWLNHEQAPATDIEEVSS